MLKILLALFGIGTAVVFSPGNQAPDQPNAYCHTCEMIINQVRSEYHNNFKSVTPSQLEASLIDECDMDLAGPANDECHTIASNNTNTILYMLQNGFSTYKICCLISPPPCS